MTALLLSLVLQNLVLLSLLFFIDNSLHVAMLIFFTLHCGLLKIEAVTRRILWINSTDPQAKILVFSSWNDVLDVLQHAFTANSISYIRMKGGR